MKRIEQILLLFSLLTLLGIAVSEIHSFDIFWQLQSGKYMLETKSFIRQDIFSLAFDVPRWEHCWLHDIIFYGAYYILGYTGLSLLKGVLVAATALTLVVASRIRGSSYLSILYLLPPVVFWSRGGWLERPQLWSFLLFALFVLILEKYRRDGGKTIFLLLPLMVLWANLHAGAILAFPVMVAYLVGEGGVLAVRRSPELKAKNTRLWLVSVLLVGAGMITPYGAEIFKALVAAPTLGTSSGVIAQIYNMDWRPTTYFSDRHFFWVMGFSAVAMLLGWRRLSLTDVLLLGGIALMGLKLSRHTTFFYLAAGAMVPVYVDTALRPLIARLRDVWKSALRLFAQAGAVVLFLYLALPAYNTYGLFGTGLRTWHYPIEAAEFVKQNRLPRNLYNTYDWGGYLMWTLYPEYRVFWDGRSDSIEMFRRGLQVMGAHPGWEKILEDYKVNTVVTKACTVATGRRYDVIDRLREDPEWALVFADESSLVFVRRHTMSPLWVKSHELPDHRVDDTILAEATLLTSVEPRRYMGYWEMARIYLARKEYDNALAALEKHLAYAPPGEHLKSAENYYRTLYPIVRANR